MPNAPCGLWERQIDAGPLSFVWLEHPTAFVIRTARRQYLPEIVFQNGKTQTGAPQSSLSEAKAVVQRMVERRSGQRLVGRWECTG